MSLPPAVAAAFELQIVELTALGRVTSIPQPPLLWGSDLSCVTDCDATFSELLPNTPLIVAQAVTRRFLTPRGAVLDDADYGLDLRSYCNRGVTVSDLRTLQARCVAEALKDERVLTVTVNVAITGALGTGLSVTGLITPADPSLTPFTFVLSVDSETTLLELI